MVELLAERQFAAAVKAGGHDGAPDAHAAHRLLQRRVRARELDRDVDADAVELPQLESDVRCRIERELRTDALGEGATVGDGVAATIQPAPWRRASCTVSRPNAPRPKIATRSPSLSEASCTACRAIVAVWSSVAVSGSSPSGSTDGSPAAGSTAKTCASA